MRGLPSDLLFNHDGADSAETRYRTTAGDMNAAHASFKRPEHQSLTRQKAIQDENNRRTSRFTTSSSVAQRESAISHARADTRAYTKPKGHPTNEILHDAKGEAPYYICFHLFTQASRDYDDNYFQDKIKNEKKIYIYTNSNSSSPLRYNSSSASLRNTKLFFALR